MPTGSDDALLLDAWREALAEVLDTERRQWRRERKLIEAQAQTTIAELRGEILRQLAAVRDGVDGAPGSAGPPGEKGDAGPPGEKGESADAILLPPELAEQVASAARLLHELPPITSERASGRVLRIERDENGALVPIYEPQS
jgi:cobalamin biosynthesis Mg chelatase CobN